MTTVKKIFTYCISFILQLLLLFYTTGKQLVLPGKNKKGNLFSSFFTLFSGLAEKLLALEKDIFGRSWLLRLRYVKTGLVLIAYLFFVLTAFEWQGARYSPLTQTPVCTEESFTACSETNVSTSVSHPLQVKSKTCKPALHNSTPLVGCLFSGPLTRRYIRYCTMRI
jgi:hypothetical protein